MSKNDVEYFLDFIFNKLSLVNNNSSTNIKLLIDEECGLEYFTKKLVIKRIDEGYEIPTGISISRIDYLLCIRFDSIVYFMNSTYLKIFSKDVIRCIYTSSCSNENSFLFSRNFEKDSILNNLKEVKELIINYLDCFISEILISNSIPITRKESYITSLELFNHEILCMKE